MCRGAHNFFGLVRGSNGRVGVVVGCGVGLLTVIEAVRAGEGGITAVATVSRWENFCVTAVATVSRLENFCRAAAISVLVIEYSIENFND